MARIALVVTALWMGASIMSSGFAAEYFVAAEGKATAKGSIDEPWDLDSTLAGQRGVKPGDTVWVRGGKYRCEAAFKEPERATIGYEVKLAGTKEKPVVVRVREGERAILDGGVTVGGNSAYVWLWGLELAPLEEIPADIREIQDKGSNPKLGRPHGGLTVLTGPGLKFINLYIHDNLGGGVGLWTTATDAEMYGCVIVNNGWKAPDRNHGHCIYTQNKDGVKTISNNIMATRYPSGQWTMHAYGSKAADTSNFLVEENTFYSRGGFLIGSGRPGANNVARGNLLYKIGMMFGYGAENEDCVIRDNVLFGGNINVRKYKKAQIEGNVIAGGGIGVDTKGEGSVQKDNRILDAAALAKEPAKAVLLPNKYDPARANLTVFNWNKTPEVEVDVSAFLKPGERFRLLDPEKLYEKPVFEGTCGGQKVKVPMAGEFGVWVVVRE